MIEDGPKRTVGGVLVKVLVHRRDDRGMRLEPFASRCVRRGEIHELLTTDHRHTGPEPVDRVGFLGFVEIGAGGVLDRGDTVHIGGRAVGTVLGFDACHFPNHYNIVIASATPVTGADLGLEPEQPVAFVPAAQVFRDGRPAVPEQGVISGRAAARRARRRGIP